MPFVFLLVALAQAPTPPPWHKLVAVPVPRLGLRALEGCSVEVVAEGPALHGATGFAFMPDGSLAIRAGRNEGWRVWDWDGARLQATKRELAGPPSVGEPRNSSGTPVRLALTSGKALAPGKPVPGTLLLGDRFPPILQGWWLTAHPDRSALVAYRMVREGAGLAAADAMELVASDRGDMSIAQVGEGPDGAVYALDSRLSPGRAGTRAGTRILRLAWAGAEDSPALAPHPVGRFAGYHKAEAGALVETLRGEDVPARFAAALALTPRVGEAKGALERLLADAEAPNDARLAALRLLEPMWKPEWTPIVTDLLEQPGDDLRAEAAQVLARRARRNDPACAGVLIKVLGDGAPTVQMAAAGALARLEIEGGADSLANALTLEEPGIPAVREAFLRALAAYGSQGMDRLLSAAESGVRRQADRAVSAAAECPGPALSESLPRWLANPNLSSGQREALLAAASRGPAPPLALAGAILNWLVEHPEEPGPTRAAGVLCLARGGILASEQGKALVRGLLKEGEPVVAAAVATAAGRGRLAVFAPEVLALSRQATSSQTARAEAVAALAALGNPGFAEAARAFLEEANLAGDSVPPVISTIWEALFRLDPAQAARVAEIRLPGLGNPALARAILAQGRADREIALRLARAALPAGISQADLKALLEDPGLLSIRKELMEHWLLSRGKEPVSTGPGWSLAETGLTLFRDPAVGCLRCHQENGTGPLAGLGAGEVLRGRPRREAVRALLHPQSRRGAVAFKLKNGQELAGLVTREAKGLVFILGSDGLARELASGDIASRKPLGRSLMPDHLVADLSLEKAEALAALVERGIPGALEPKPQRMAVVSPREAASLLEGKLGEPAWAEPSAAHRPGPAGILVEGIVEGAAEGPARLLVEGGVVERVWVDGAVQPETIPALRKGSSRVVLWVVPEKGQAVRWRLAKATAP